MVATVDWGGVDYEDRKRGRNHHVFTLKARVHVTVRAVPVIAGLAGGVGAGEGASQLVIDARDRSGYAHYVTVPMKKD